jgi:hypothetical protein
MNVAGSLLRKTIAVLLVALAARAALSLASGHTTPIIDMEEYLRLAQGLTDGRGYAGQEGPTAFRPPLYPAFLALVRIVWGDSVLAIRLAQGVLGALTCVLTVFLAGAVVGRERTHWAGLLVALYPTHVMYASYLHREVLFTFLLVGALALLARRGSARSLAAGIVLGLAALTNSAALGTAPLAALYLVTRRQGRRAALLLAGTVLVIAPWTVRNYRIFGSFVPVNTKAGVVFWEGNDEGWLRGETEWDIRNRHWRQLDGMEEDEAHRHGMRQALQFVRRNPGGFLYLCWRRFLQFWRLELLFYFYLKMGYWGAVPTWAAVALAPVTLAPFPLLVLAAVVGALGIGRPKGIWALALIFGATQLIGASLTVGGFRYHFPLIPILAVAALALPEGVVRLRSQRRAALAVSVLAALACFNWVDHLYANRHQVRGLLGVPGGRLDDHLTRSWMKRGIF